MNKLLFLPACLLLLGLGPAGAGAGAEAAPAMAGPRNVILIIVDGMSFAAETGASWYSHGPDKPRGLSFHSWPGQALLTSWDLDSWQDYAPAGSRFDHAAVQPQFGYDPARGGLQPQLRPDADGNEAYFLTRPQAQDDGELKQATQPATDSASSATAYACGRKVDSGCIAWDSRQPAALESIGERLRRQSGGRAGFGAVSTVPFNHATPAAFTAHAERRSRYIEIAEQVIAQPPDIIVGGGHPAWYSRKAGAALKPYLSTEQYQTLRNDPRFEFVERQSGVEGGAALLEAAQRARAARKPLFGLFGGRDALLNKPRATGDPAAPWNSGSDENPDCAELALAALEVLDDPQRFPDGFLLMVEQGDVDWACHAGEWDWALGAMHDADECARRLAQRLAEGRGSATLANTLLLLVPDHAHYLRLGTSYPQAQYSLPPGSSERPERNRRDPYWRRYSPWGAVVWSGPLYHSNELITLYACGAEAAPGGAAGLLDAWRGLAYGGGPGSPGLLDNTAVYHIMASWLNLDEPPAGPAGEMR